MAGDARDRHQSLTHPETLDRFRKLHHSRRARDEAGLFVVEGLRNFVQAVDHGWTLDTIIWCDALLKSGLVRKLLRDQRRRGVPCIRISPEDFRSISSALHASGIAAVVRQPSTPLHRLPPRSGTCWLVLRRVRSPGNLGSLLRTSAAAGGAGLIVVGGDVDPYDPSVVRASMGAIFRQAVVRTGAARLGEWVQRHRLHVVGASPSGERLHFDAPYPRSPLIVLGEEREGLAPELEAICHERVRIPMTAGTDSLNLAVAGSLLIYEVLRRRRPKERAAT